MSILFWGWNLKVEAWTKTKLMVKSPKMASSYHRFPSSYQFGVPYCIVHAIFICISHNVHSHLVFGHGFENSMAGFSFLLAYLVPLHLSTLRIIEPRSNPMIQVCGLAFDTVTICWNTQWLGKRPKKVEMARHVHIYLFKILCAVFLVINCTLRSKTATYTHMTLT